MGVSALPSKLLLRIPANFSKDLCNEQKVRFYPQMQMYKDGELVEVFKGSRDWSKLVGFIQKHSDAPKVEVPEAAQAIFKDTPAFA